MENRQFVRSEKDAYLNSEKRKLGDLVNRYKVEYDNAVVERAGKTKYDKNRRSYVPDLPKKDFVSRAVRDFYSDMVDKKSNDPDFVRAIKVARCAFNALDELCGSMVCPPKKACVSGGGRKSAAPEVRQALFGFFINVRSSLKGKTTVVLKSQ